MATELKNELKMGLLVQLIDRYKLDQESVYNTWFAGSENRLKAFRAIKTGVKDTFSSIAAGSFSNDFRGSPLEVVITAITEQKQVFAGAAHAFYWKPKLRIPDIYENEENKLKFGNFLESCYCATKEEQVLEQLSRLAGYGIKGLGPAVANIVYFLHPTIILPFNTAMVNGFNALLDEKVKLGSWESYFAMRETCQQINSHPEVKSKLSKDLGAIAGLLFELGCGRLVIEGNVSRVLAAENEKAKKAAKARHQEVLAEINEESEHTKIQYMLLKIGRELGLDVHVARNDRHRSFNGESFAQLTINEIELEGIADDAQDIIGLIDVIWLEKATNIIVSAFEVEKSTSIYSGILRMEDLSRSLLSRGKCGLYLVAPDVREREVIAQFERPSFKKALADIPLSFIPFSELIKHRDSLGRLGEDHRIMQKIARHCTCAN